MFQTKVVEKNTHFMFSNFSGRRAVYVVMLKSAVDRPHMTI
jgi:hypothetical protein